MPWNRPFRWHFTHNIADKVIKGTKEERTELRKKEGYTVISKTGEFEQLKLERF